jgi:hypothetical protein
LDKDLSHFLFSFLFGFAVIMSRLANAAMSKETGAIANLSHASFQVIIHAAL